MSDGDEAADIIGVEVVDMPWATMDEDGVPQVTLVSGELAPTEWPGRVRVLNDNTALSDKTFDHTFAREYLKQEEKAPFNIKGLSTALAHLLKQMPLSSKFATHEACAEEVKDLLIGAGFLTKRKVQEMGGIPSSTFDTRARMLLGKLDNRQQAGTEWRRNKLGSLGSGGVRAFDPLTGVLFEPADSAIEWPRR